MAERRLTASQQKTDEPAEAQEGGGQGSGGEGGEGGALEVGTLNIIGL